MSRTASARLLTPLVLAPVLGSAAFAGPPFVTDDPEPVDYRHFEIDIAAFGTVAGSGGTGNLGFGPDIDANWGAAPGLQLHAQIGIAYAERRGQPQSGDADTDFGFKYRVLDQSDDGWWPEVSVYPHIEMPTGDAARGLGAGYIQGLLPVWLERDWGTWSSFGGVGYWLNRHGENRNNWFLGWALLRRVGDDLNLGGEVFHQTGQAVGAPETTGFNLGGTWDLSATGHILFSAGRGLEHAAATDRFSVYLGYQITL